MAFNDNTLHRSIRTRLKSIQSGNVSAPHSSALYFLFPKVSNKQHHISVEKIPFTVTMSRQSQKIRPRFLNRAPSSSDQITLE